MSLDMTHGQSTTQPTAATDSMLLSRGPIWANRFALAPLTNTQSHPDGTLSDDEYRWLVARAAGGFGLTLTCATYVDPGGKAWQGQLGISDDRHLPGLARLADGIRAAGSVSSVQLHHGGRRADPALTGVPNVAPWTDASRNTRALTTGEIQLAVEQFVAAAVRAEMAGFDGVEVHGAHGYLVCQFLDGRHNQRTDGYGGALEDRSRMLFDILRGIRARTGASFQVGLRLTPEGNGITLPESITVASQVLTSGLVDYLDMSLWDAFKTPNEPGVQGLLINQFTTLERGATRLGVAGKILTAADVRWCLEHGADFVTVGTGAILQHDFPRLVAADAGFVSTPHPVSRDHLRAQSVGDAFIAYLANGWDDFVA